MTGTRAMTASSGPGIALMQESVGHLGSAEIGLVVVDCQRAGPSTGMPTKPEQSDVDMLVHGGSGDFPRVVLANPDLTVIAAGGDGDGYAIGAGHLVHAFRRNANLAYVVMSNETYGLTKGQSSPTRTGEPGHMDGRLDAVAMGLPISSTTFLARGYGGWSEQLHRLTRQALEHVRTRQGFAFLEVVSPCVTYWDTYPVWEQVLHDVDAEPGYDPSDRTAAFVETSRLAAEGRPPAGLIYRAPPVTPAPAAASVRAEIDPAALATRYEAILDGFMLGRA
jgi:pyruvate/2-oxoacid:ferredoxin oxidoreductase beta subunit